MRLGLQWLCAFLCIFASVVWFCALPALGLMDAGWSWISVISLPYLIGNVLVMNASLFVDVGRYLEPWFILSNAMVFIIAFTKLYGNGTATDFSGLPIVIVVSVCVTFMDAFPPGLRGKLTVGFTAMTVLFCSIMMSEMYFQTFLTPTFQLDAIVIGNTAWSLESLASTSGSNLILFISKNFIALKRFPECYVVVKSRIETKKIVREITTKSHSGVS
jgi:hypothetical protein